MFISLLVLIATVVVVALTYSAIRRRKRRPAGLISSSSLITASASPFSTATASMSYAAFSDGDSSTAVGSSFVRFADEDEEETQKETAS